MENIYTTISAWWVSIFHSEIQEELQWERYQRRLDREELEKTRRSRDFWKRNYQDIGKQHELLATRFHNYVLGVMKEKRLNQSQT